MLMSSHHGEPSRTTVRVVGPDERVGVVSDIDDTVLVTALPRPLRAFWNTFARHESTRRPVAGMPDLFRHLRGDGPEPFTAYVSTGPWNLAPVAGAVPGPARLPARSAADDRLGADRRPVVPVRPRSTSTTACAGCSATCPQLTWTLVGDDGQHDPALYDDLAAEYPDRVRLVLIRELTPTEQVLTHGTPTTRPGEGARDRPPPPGVPVLRGPDGAALVRALRGRRA